MKKMVLVLLLIAAVAGLAMADGKFSTSSYFYAYENLQTNYLYFELTPTFTLTFDKLAFILGGDSTFDAKSLALLADGPAVALNSGYAYLGASYNAGFATIYAHPGIYHDGLFFLDSEITFNIPHFPVTFEYLTNDAKENAGNVYAWVGIVF